jgi:aryl-alcohol dehydrogenase-like predicted oxidoreductase
VTRRELLRAAALAPLALAGGAAAPGGRMRTRTIPSSGEELPVVGLGTWQTFDVGASAGERAPLREVLRLLLEGGGRVIDSSPMYGRSEAVVGDLLRADPGLPRAFVATKVWTTGTASGAEQMARSEERMGGRLDLLQIHNLLDWQGHLPALREWKAAGRVRYVGITHYSTGAFEEMERILRRERVDFVQLPYSAATLEAEERLLPAARDTGTAVLVMRPFEQGSLLRTLRDRPLPAFAAEVGATSWAQLLLKFILSHPAVTAVIPATSKPAHLEDNLRAGAGPLLDAAQRGRLLAELA